MQTSEVWETSEVPESGFGGAEEPPLAGAARAAYNARVKALLSEARTRPPGPVALGTACCVFSAFGYAAANMCLRKLAALGADEMWTTAMKEVVTVSVVGPWLALQAARGRPVLPPARWAAVLVLAGLVTQLCGNVALQWSFGVVGLAIAVPACFALLLAGGALLGRMLLGEGVSAQSVGAIGVLVAAIALLSFGAVREGALIPGTAPPWKMALGVAAACGAGAAFAQLSLAIRTTASRGVPVPAVVLIVTGMGVVCLGPLSLARLGPATLLATTAEQLGYMLGAGAFNLLAFLAITKGLQLTTIVRANVLNAGQVALGAVAGVLVFGESWNPWVVCGVVLTIAGLMLVGQPQSEEQEVPGA